ncbi:WhiB family transcriptional regulator [Micromonospora sp. NPDC047548]|uniref:WhiB family transcriptional regulator n=1 Tax=Micromonospora sp. NPDC047548 TaxID=3155624 RepID=UPI0033CE23C0
MTTLQITKPHQSWWEQAECRGLDPSWWFESRLMWQQAAHCCIVCPVRDQCIEDAIHSGDLGVVRGASWFTDSRHGRQILPLICEACGSRPVAFTQSTVSRHCPTCRRYRCQMQ